MVEYLRPYEGTAAEHVAFEAGWRAHAAAVAAASGPVLLDPPRMRVFRYGVDITDTLR